MVENKLKKTDKISVYYYGSGCDPYYRCRVTTVKTFQKWCETGDKKAKDVAFIYVGHHKDLLGTELVEYIEKNNVVKLDRWQVKNM